MKKIILVGVIVALILIIVGGAGIAYAQLRGLDRNALVTVNSVLNNDEIVRQFSYGPGGMMGGQGFGYGPGMMGGQGYGNGSGMMGGQGYGYGPDMMGERGFRQGSGMIGGRGFAEGRGLMHDYMISAFADAVDLTVDEVETRLTNSETLYEIAIAQGTAEADLPALISQVHQAALDSAVADGVITQAQADFMKERMGNYSGKGFGRDDGEGCPMWDEQQEP